MHKYVEILTTPLQVCRRYKPGFGKSNAEGVSLAEFREMYGADPLYSWIGLDSDEIYAAHKAAGGITSFYRQLGIGCERLVREILIDKFALDSDEATWSYTYANAAGDTAKLSLDARIDVRLGTTKKRSNQIESWLSNAGELLNLSDDAVGKLFGAVFEVRQGYKSADAKRQNADLRNGIRAYNEGYLPVVMILSNQINSTVSRRYTNGQILVLSGEMNDDENKCTYAFFKKVIGFDLAGFLIENRTVIQKEIKDILKNIIRA